MGCFRSRDVVDLKFAEQGRDEDGKPAKKTLKVVMIGDAGVGKTSLVRFLSGRPFTSMTKPTITLDYTRSRVRPLERKMNLPMSALSDEADDRILSIRDCAGQERYRSLRPMVMRGADLVIYCVDPEGMATNSAENVFKDCVEAMQYAKNSRVLFVLTKCDLLDGLDSKKVARIKSTFDDLYNFVKPHGLRSVSCSSRTGQNMEILVAELVNLFGDLSVPLPIIRNSVEILLLGPPGVGKTTFIKCLSNPDVQPKDLKMMRNTVGTDVSVLKLCEKKKTVTVKVWDTAGQERFLGSIPPIMFRKAQIVLLVFEASHPDFKKLINTWERKAREHVPKDAVVEIIAMKSDLLAEEKKEWADVASSRNFFSRDNPRKIANYIKELVFSLDVRG